MHPVARAALAVAAIVVTVTFFGLCAFDRASIDDYWIAAQVRDEGLLGAQALWYTGWHGKFSSMLAMSTFAWVVDIGDQYWLAPALLLTAMWAACVSIVRVLAPAQGWRATLGVASVLFAFWAARPANRRVTQEASMPLDRSPRSRAWRPQRHSPSRPSMTARA